MESRTCTVRKDQSKYHPKIYHSITGRMRVMQTNEHGRQYFGDKNLKNRQTGRNRLNQIGERTSKLGKVLT